MSTEFEKIVLQEFTNMKQGEDRILQELNVIKQNINVLQEEVTELKQDVVVLKEDVTELKQDVAVLKKEVTKLKSGMKEVKEDIAVLKNEVFNVIKPKLKTMDEKLDIMININSARILKNQSENHKEQIELLKKYESQNELEHSRLNYEICKIKANA